MAQAVVAIGSNLGDRLARLREAVAALSSVGEVRAVASLYETEAVGGPSQGRFLNSAVAFDTELSAHRLLAALHRIEDAAGRTREIDWGPRTLDLDLIVLGGAHIDDDVVTIPHPRAAARRFVADPVAEVAPEAELAPGVIAADAAQRLRGEPGVLRFDGDWVDGVPSLGTRGAVLLGLQGLLIVAMIVMAWTTATIPIPVWQTYVGLGLSGAGALMAGWAGVALGRWLRAHPDPPPGGPLVERGPYGFVRHPIYGAILMGGFGLVLMFNSAWAALPLVLLGGVFVRKANLEERAIALLHPQYATYRIRVPRLFVPWVW